MAVTALRNLKNRLYTDASLQGLTNDEVAAILSTPITSITQPCMYTDKMLVRDLDTTTALTLIGIVNTVATNNTDNSPLFTLIQRWLTDGTGIDLGLQKTRDLINSFVTSSLMTSDQASQVEALAEKVTYSSGGPCTSADVALAIASNAADVLASQLNAALTTKIASAKQQLADYQTAVANGSTPTVPTIMSILA